MKHVEPEKLNLGAHPCSGVAGRVGRPAPCGRGVWIEFGTNMCRRCFARGRAKPHAGRVRSPSNTVIRVELFVRLSDGEPRNLIAALIESVRVVAASVPRVVVRLTLAIVVAVSLRGSGLAGDTVASSAALSDSVGPLALWYRQPARQWVEALPIGNGRLGAMVFGGVPTERVQFNESTLWIGEPRDYSHPGAAAYLPRIRELLFAGKQREAEALAMEKFMSVPLRQMPYQPFGDVILEFPGHDEPTDYRRALDLEEAVATVRYRVGDVTFEREAFASAPARLIMVRLGSCQPGKLNFRVRLTCPHSNAVIIASPDGKLVLRGRLPERYPRAGIAITNPLRFEAQLETRADGGTVRATNQWLEVENANAAVLLLAAATSFKNFQDVSGDPAEVCARARLHKRVASRSQN